MCSFAKTYADMVGQKMAAKMYRGQIATEITIPVIASMIISNARMIRHSIFKFFKSKSIGPPVFNISLKTQKVKKYANYL